MSREPRSKISDYSHRQHFTRDLGNEAALDYACAGFCGIGFPWARDPGSGNAALREKTGFGECCGGSETGFDRCKQTIPAEE